VALGALEPKFFAEFAQRIGLPDRFVKRQYDAKLWPEMRAAIAAIFATRTRDEWAALLEGTDACVAPVLSLTEAPRHAHARARAGFVEVGGVTQAAPAPRFSRTTAEQPRPAPRIGEHSESVLAEAGFSSGEIAALCDAGALLQAAAR
jgi:alpha-methylacyl-CoA racemase